MRQHRDSERLFAVAFARIVFKPLPGAHRLHRDTVKRGAFFGEGQRLSRAVEKSKAQALFELRDHAACGRGRKGDFVGGGQKTARFDDRAEKPDRFGFELHGGKNPYKTRLR